MGFWYGCSCRCCNDAVLYLSIACVCLCVTLYAVVITARDTVYGLCLMLAEKNIEF